MPRRPDPQLVDRLCRQRNGDLQTLMIEVMRIRATRQKPRDVRRAHERRFCPPSDVDARALHRVDTALFAAASDFTLLELSPVAPLGVCAAVAPCDPRKSMATVRNLEVVSDSSNVLAVEAARRRQDGAPRADLAASHRLLRVQSFDNPDFRAHFRLFALCSMFPSIGSGRAELAAIESHLRVYETAASELGGVLEKVSISCAGQPWTRIRERLAETHLRVDDADDRIGSNAYYQGLSFIAHVRTPAGSTLPLGDGGFTDWGARLASRAKERTLVSAIGSELLARCL